MLKKLLLTASVVCMFVVIPSVASAAALDGETLTGALSAHGCSDNGDGTSGPGRHGAVTNGVATGPVPGTYDGGFNATWNNTTGSVTDLGGSFDIYDALATTTRCR